MREIRLEKVLKLKQHNKVENTEILVYILTMKWTRNVTPTIHLPSPHGTHAVYKDVLTVPPVVQEEGSTASTDTLFPRPVSIFPTTSMKVDFPAPGGPERPRDVASMTLSSTSVIITQSHVTMLLIGH